MADDPSAEPPPYDPAIHGEALPDSTAHLNLVNRGVNLPDMAADRQSRRSRLPTQTPGDGDKGFFILTGRSIDGVYAGHDVNTDISMSLGVTFYAPTLQPPDVNNSNRIGCLESVTIHRYNWGTEHAHGFWDHCINNTWTSYKKMDATWLNTYTSQFDGELRYFTQVVKVTNGWQGYLYNFAQGQWEWQSTIVSSNTPCCWTGGWTMWESYGTVNAGCPDSKSIRAAPVQVRYTSGSWANLGPADSSSLSTTNGCSSHYDFRVNYTNYDWQVDYLP